MMGFSAKYIGRLYVPGFPIPGSQGPVLMMPIMFTDIVDGSLPEVSIDVGSF